MNINLKRLDTWQVCGKFENQFLENLQDHIEYIEQNDIVEFENFDLLDYINDYVDNTFITYDLQLELLDKYVDWDAVSDKIIDNNVSLSQSVLLVFIDVLMESFRGLKSEFDDDEFFDDWK